MLASPMLSCSCGKTDVDHPDEPGGELPLVRETACKEPFEQAEVFAKVKSNVVRLEDPSAGISGTGFIIHTGTPDEMVIVTNYHVVMGGNEFQAYVPTPAGKQMRVAGLEIVKIDPDDDLALLHTAGAPSNVDGLRFASTVAVAQPILVTGYPFVAGSEFSTVPEPEDGTITSTSRKFETNTYLQTNANINPGNSGGPAVDACGDVVGVATAKAMGVDRVGLLVAGPKVVELYDEWMQPRADPKLEIERQLEDFRIALSYGDPYAAAGLASYSFIRNVVVPDYLARQQEATQMLVQEAQVEFGVSLDQLSQQEVELLLGHVSQEHLDPLQNTVLMLTLLLGSGQIDERLALQSYLGAVMLMSFDGLSRLDVERIQLRGENDATVYVQVTDARGVRRMTIDFTYERGRWQANGFAGN